METNSGNISHFIKRFTGFLLLLALSAVFLFSAGTKLWIIEPFEWSFTDILPVNVMAAAIIARLFIGLEIMIGLFLLAHIFLKKFTYKATLWLLVLLTLYLVLLVIKTGNQGSCGCFGAAYEMKPLTAIWKNLAMIAATIALTYLYPVRPYRRQLLVGIILLVISFTIPFVIQPVYIFNKSKLIHQPISLAPIYRLATPAPAMDLRKGKHVIAFFSLTCPHCKVAAYRMQLLYKQYPDMPFYVVLGGQPVHLKDFLKESKLSTLPYTLLTDVPGFVSMAGEVVPAVYWVNNGIIEKKSFMAELEPGMLKRWLAGELKH